MNNNLIDVGQIVNTHGLKGEVKVNPWTDAPEVFELFTRVYTEDGRAFEVRGVRYQKSCVLLKLKGIDDVDSAESMRNKTLYAERELFSDLPQDTFLVADIIGLIVKENEKEYGKVTDVITTGSNDVYTVRQNDGRMIYIPAIKSVVKEINIKSGYIEIEMPAGLID